MPHTAALVLAALAGLAACGDKRPKRPDDATFRAMNEREKCRVTTPRAITCADEIIIEQLRTMPGLDNADEIAADAEKQNAKQKPLTPKQRIQVHEDSCAGIPHYADAVLACWDVEGCKPFADCVMRASAPKPTRHDVAPIDEDAPDVDEPPAVGEPPTPDGGRL
jgi:hypothetical protein